MKKYVLKKPYRPGHGENRMKSEGSVSDARALFLKNRFRNVEYLLKFRYEWMNKYLQPGKTIIEIGAGAGLSPLYLNEKPILTDAVNNPWIDKYIDATNMDLEDGFVDVIIASHNIHHFYSPYKFFKECERVLKKDGIILIQEINTSLFMRFLLKLMRHEGWSYNVNVFNPHEIVNDADDLWSANCAVPEMLFSDPNSFEQEFTSLRFMRNEPCECLIFPLSGGVISKVKIPMLPKRVLNFVLFVDKCLVAMLPNIFALGRRVVLKKNGS
jgi:SAM-dependent methyltransferase